jgi:VanZ family protein
LPKNSLKNKTISIIVALLYFLLSTYLLTLPGSQFPKITWMDKIPLFDKWVHIGLFAILTFLWCRVLVKYTVKKMLTVAIVCLLYGVAIEFIQDRWIPFRSFEAADIIADAVGCTLGFLVSKRWLLKKSRG